MHKVKDLSVQNKLKIKSVDSSNQIGYLLLYDSRIGHVNWIFIIPFGWYYWILKVSEKIKL